MIKIFKLYVLKEQIDKVKTPKEAEKEKMERELLEKNVPLAELQNKTLKTRPNKDDTIDTVELPKIGEDGIIKENTAELPIVKSNRSFNEQSFESTEIEMEIPETPIVEEKKEIDIPVLKKKDSDNIEIDNLAIQKNILKRKDN